MVQQYMILKLFIFQNTGIEKKNNIYIHMMYIVIYKIYRG
jgi:hypothetical protein